MPTIQLTPSQAELVQEILDAQSGCKVGYNIGCVNFSFDRLTGERTAELSFIELPWAAAVALAKKARKLSEEANCARSEKAPAGKIKSKTRPTLDRIQHPLASPL